MALKIWSTKILNGVNSSSSLLVFTWFQRGPLVDGAGSPILALLGSSRLWLRLPPNRPFWGVIVCTLGHIFNLDVLLDPEEDVSHLGNFVLH